jgi:hypothetical protein
VSAAEHVANTLAIDGIDERAAAGLAGTAMIETERERVRFAHGREVGHGPDYSRQLRAAAVCYLNPDLRSDAALPLKWPWPEETWKPADDPIVNAVRAGQLVAAAIDMDVYWATA